MKQVFLKMNSMSDACFQILRGGLMVASTLLLCSAALILNTGPLSLDTYYVHRCADTMREMAPVVLFLAVFGSAWCEERAAKMK